VTGTALPVTTHLGVEDVLRGDATRHPAHHRMLKNDGTRHFTHSATVHPPQEPPELLKLDGPQQLHNFWISRVASAG
jgi:hypothetical protein